MKCCMRTAGHVRYCNKGAISDLSYYLAVSLDAVVPSIGGGGLLGTSIYRPP